jgi:hypothetical protein
MGALPIPEPYPHALYVEELHDFFTAHGLHYGSPADLASLVDRLDDPGLFHEDMRAVVRLILAREQNSIARSDLLAILAVAVGGPLIYRSAQQLRQPLGRLLAFVDGVLRRTPGDASRPEPLPRAEVIQFPATPGTNHSAAGSRSRVWLTSIPRSALRSLRPSGPASPSFRKVLWVAAGVTVVVVLLALLLRPHHPVAAAVITRDGSYAPKPSAYGKGFEPSFSSFLHDSVSAPVTYVRQPVSSPESDSLTPSALSGATGQAEPAGVAQPASLPNTHPAAAPSPASLRLAPEFSQPAPAGVVPSPSPSTPASAVEPAPPAGAVPTASAPPPSR